MESWKEQLLSTAKTINKWTTAVFNGLKNLLTPETFSKLVEFLSSLPDDIQETELFKKTHDFKNKEISQNDIEWFQDYMNCSTFEISLSKLREKVEKTNLDGYIISIINANNISSREKLVILLAHFESVFYQAITSERKQNDTIKSIASNNAKDAHEMRIENYNKILIKGIILIVFANTDKYKDIDKNIPFRNNILHRGTLDYTNNEIENAYRLLVCFMAELITINE